MGTIVRKRNSEGEPTMTEQLELNPAGKLWNIVPNTYLRIIPPVGALSSLALELLPGGY